MIKNNRRIKSIIATLALSISLAGCATTQANTVEAEASTTEKVVVEATTSNTTTEATETTSAQSTTIETSVISSSEGSLLDTAEMFTARDLEQTVDLTEAQIISLSSSQDVTITDEGVYVLSGDVENVTVIVEADDEDNIQLVLDGVNINNVSAPVIYVKSGDKVFITSTSSTNTMSVSGLFEAEGETNLDAVIYSKSDLVFNGTGSLEIISTRGNGITSKDDLKITGGVYAITAADDAIEANDSIRIYDGDITIETNKDALHSENEADTTLGYIYIYGGIINISAVDDAIRATSFVQIDGGTINIETCAEGIEGTTIQINGGDIDIYATDDGINAAEKSDYDVIIEVNGGNITIVMASGDTDGFDANGDIIINGGTISVEANSSFDANDSAILNGGTVIVNGETVTELPTSRMGGKSRK